MDVLLETERLILRRFTRDDVDNLVDLDSDPQVMRYINGGRPTPREEIAEDYLPAFLGYYERFAGYGFFAAIERSTGEFLGWFHLRPRADRPRDEPELGYRLRRSAWGRGYAGEGSRALVDRAFADLGARRVYAETMAVNAASRRVMEKAGLRYVRTFFQEWPDTIEGGERGDVEYALTREEWQRVRVSRTRRPDEPDLGSQGGTDLAEAGRHPQCCTGAMVITEDLIRRWLDGWLIARGVPGATAVPDGIEVRSDQPGRQVEVFVLRADEDPDSVTRLAARVSPARLDTWLTVPTQHPGEVAATVTGAGLEVLHRAEWLMSTDLTGHPAHAPAAPYRSEVRTEGPVVTVSILDASGELAARGVIGVAGTDAVADKITTEPAHRRRGLASALMSALAEAAVAQGARTGLLIASEEGQQLYASLGWRREADVVIARAAPAQEQEQARKQEPAQVQQPAQEPAPVPAPGG